LFELVVKGGPVMIPLGLCSIVALGVLAERLWRLHRTGRETSRLLSALGSEALPSRSELLMACRRSAAPLARVVLAAAEMRNPPSLAAAERQGAEEARRLEGHLPAVDAVVTLAPLLGLLGTITGMIQSFGVLSVQGGENPFAVTGGIAEALITTATGLIVAVVAFAGYAWCQHLMEREVHQMETVVGDLLERVHWT
jgi:biopolymer transport protein ExbB